MSLAARAGKLLAVCGLLALPAAAADRVDADRLMGRIERLVGFGTRHSMRPESGEVATWIADQFRSWGYQVRLERVPWFGQEWHNVIATRRGTVSPDKIYVLGAHYDSQAGDRFRAEALAPGADDNASGMAAVLEAAEILKDDTFAATVQFIAFAGEEQMLRGSLIHADGLPSDEEHTVEAAIVLEMIGFTGPTQEAVPGCPEPPASGGDFLGVLANEASAPLMARFQESAARNVPELKVEGCVNGLVARSDHFPFWLVGVPALMLTDTANFRNPHYHTPGDTPETLDPVFAARSAQSAMELLGELAGREPAVKLAAPGGDGVLSLAAAALGALLGAVVLQRRSRRGPEAR